MSEWVTLLLSLSLSGSLLALVLFIMKPLFKRRLSKAWQYYIWLVVIFRFFIPFTPETSLVGGMMQAIQLSHNAVQARGISEKPDAVPPEFIEAEAASSVFARQEIVQREKNAALPVPFEATSSVEQPAALPLTPAADTATSAASKADTTVSFVEAEGPLSSEIWQVLGFGWMMIAIVLLLQKLAGYRGFVRYMRAGSCAVKEQEVLMLYRQACDGLSVRHPPALCSSKAASSPMLVGVFRPVIILPEGQLGAITHLPYVFRHELTHYNRLDPLYKWLFQMVACIHFFNPLIYLIGRELTRAGELSCDEAVIAALDSHERKVYGSTLIDALEYRGGYGVRGMPMALCDNAKFMKERLESIKMASKKSKAVSVVSASLAVLLCCGAVYTGAYAVRPSILPVTPRPAPTVQVAAQAQKSSAILTAAPATAAALPQPKANVPAGYTLLKEATIPLTGIESIQMGFGVEEVILHPSGSNALYFADYGRSSFSFAKEELVQYEVKGTKLIIEAGEWNQKWSRIQDNSYVQKVDVFLPADFGGDLDCSITAGTFTSITSLRVGAATLSSGSGHMNFQDVSAAGELSLSNLSGTSRLGTLTGKTCTVSNGSGTLETGRITAQQACEIFNISGTLTVQNISGHNCTLENGSGHFSLGDAAAQQTCSVSSISGPLTVKSISGTNCTLDNGSSTVTLGNLSAQKTVDISSISGPVTLGAVSSERFAVQMGSGKMKMQSLAGAGSMSSISGTIESGLLRLTGPLEIETGSGTIKATLAKDIGVRFTGMRGGSGHFDVPFSLAQAGDDQFVMEREVRGTFGSAPYREMTANVISGTVELRQES